MAKQAIAHQDLAITAWPDDLSRRFQELFTTCLLFLVGSSVFLAIPLLATASPGDAAKLEVAATSLVARAENLFQLDKLVTERGGDFAKLSRDLVELAQQLEHAGLDSLCSHAYARAGWSATRTGRGAEASTWFERSVAAAERHGHPVILLTARNMQATFFATRGDVEAALLRWADVLALRDRIANPDLFTPMWNNIANAYANLGRLPQAMVAAESAFVIPRRAGNLRGIAATSMLRARLLHQLGRHEEALAWNDTALARARVIGNEEMEASALHQRGILLQSLGRLGEALALTREAIARFARMGGAFLAMDGRLAEATLLLRLEHPDSALNAIGPLLDSAGGSPDPQFRARARAVRATALASLGPAAEVEAVLASDVESFEAMRGRDPGGAGWFARGGEIYPALARVLLAKGRTSEAWATIERGRARTLRQRLDLEQDPMARLPALQRHLSEARAALIQYDEARLNPPIAYIVTGDSLAAVWLAWDGNGRDARQVLDLMASGASDQTCAPGLERLGQALLGRVIERLPPELERVYLVPHSAVAGLPLEALLIPGGGSLGDRYAVSYVPSAMALNAILERGAASGPMVVFGDPERGGAKAADAEPVASSLRGIEDMPLPHSRAEARRVAARGAAVHLGAEATRSRLMTEIHNQPAVIHFATHAIANPMRPELSSILLAGDREGFTAAEVESLPIRADLVALSGCRTGGGFTYIGEGTFGLARSFLVAGARSVVMTMWDVDDRAAARMMQHFYAGLRKGLPRDEALRRARGRMAREGFPHRDRSAFVLVGAGAEPVLALVEPRAALLGWPGIAIAVVILLGIVILLARRYVSTRM